MLDLTRVLHVLRDYHRIAWLTQRQGPEIHQRMLDKAAKIESSCDARCRAVWHTGTSFTGTEAVGAQRIRGGA